MNQYQLIPTSPLTHDEGSILHNQEKQLIAVKPFYWERTWRFILALSLIGNIVLGTIVFLGSRTVDVEKRSKFAGLARNIPMQWKLNYFVNETTWNETWESSSYDPGVIALDDTYAQAMGLPRAQRWPWDITKGIYLINAYHNMHCVKSLKQTLDEFHLSLPQSIEWEHVRHCLLVLRDEIVCNADDVPRYSGFQPPHSSGLGQARMCRDWDALEQWASDKDRAGCWRVVPGDEDREGFSYLDRYRFCPEGSPYKEMAETKYLSHRPDEDRE